VQSGGKQVANGDAQGQGRVPRHRELDPDELFRKIYPYVPGDGKQLQDYWDADVISTANARNSSLGEGVEHPAPFPEDIVHFPKIWFKASNFSRRRFSLSGVHTGRIDDW
jgi:hypothetical protein